MALNRNFMFERKRISDHLFEWVCVPVPVPVPLPVHICAHSLLKYRQCFVVCVMVSIYVVDLMHYHTSISTLIWLNYYSIIWRLNLPLLFFHRLIYGLLNALEPSQKNEYIHLKTNNGICIVFQLFVPLFFQFFSYSAGSIKPSSVVVMSINIQIVPLSKQQRLKLWAFI